MSTEKHEPPSTRPQLEGIEQQSEGWINKYLLRYRLPDGTPYEYEAVSRKRLAAYRGELARLAAGGGAAGDGVCIVPVLADGSVLLIHEFRYPVNAWVVGLPAGLVEPGEELAACVERELLEETGYRLVRDGRPALAPLAQAGLSSTGMTEESVRVVFARVEPAREATPEPGELIRPFVLAADEIEDFLANNRSPIGTRAQLALALLARAGVGGVFEK